MLKNAVLVAVTALGLAACAHTMRPSDEVKIATAADLVNSANRVAPATCEQTGSRIPRKAGEGTAQPCREYSGTDIERTGMTSLEDALRKLDPAIQ